MKNHTFKIIFALTLIFSGQAFAAGPVLVSKGYSYYSPVYSCQSSLPGGGLVYGQDRIVFDTNNNVSFYGSPCNGLAYLLRATDYRFASIIAGKGVAEDYNVVIYQNVRFDLDINH